MAVAAAGNKIVFAGGTSEDPPSERYGSSRVDIFDIANQSWSTAELSVPRSSITAISAGNKIFFAGGYAGELGDLEYYYSTVDIYDVSTNSWSVANLSEPRIGMAAATVGNKVYFAGGYNNGSCSNKVDIYDISSGTWSLTALSESKAGISAVSHQNKIYFAGGSNGIFFSNRIDIYDNASNSWSTSSLSEPKSGMAGVASGDKIYWSGGYNGQGPLCKVEIRDLLTQTTSFDHLSNNQFSITAVLKNGVLAFIPADGVKFDIHNPISNSWTVGVKPINTIYASIISINNNLYLAGGISSNNNAYSREVWKLEF
jgi:N-acetylneuraminic acid mutarotase